MNIEKAKTMHLNWNQVNQMNWLTQVNQVHQMKKIEPEDKCHNMALYTCLKCLLCFNF